MTAAMRARARSGAETNPSPNLSLKSNSFRGSASLIFISGLRRADTSLGAAASFFAAMGGAQRAIRISPQRHSHFPSCSRCFFSDAYASVFEPLSSPFSDPRILQSLREGLLLSVLVFKVAMVQRNVLSLVLVVSLVFFGSKVVPCSPGLPGGDVIADFQLILNAWQLPPNFSYFPSSPPMVFFVVKPSLIFEPCLYSILISGSPEEEKMVGQGPRQGQTPE